MISQKNRDGFSLKEGLLQIKLFSNPSTFTSLPSRPEIIYGQSPGSSRSQSPAPVSSYAPSDNCSNYKGDSDDEAPKITTKISSGRSSSMGHATRSSNRDDDASEQCCLYHQRFLKGDIREHTATLYPVKEEDKVDRHDSISLAQTLVGDGEGHHLIPESTGKRRDSSDSLYTHIHTATPPGRRTSTDHPAGVSISHKKDLDNRKQYPSDPISTVVVRQAMIDELSHSGTYPVNSQAAKDAPWGRSNAITVVSNSMTRRNRGREPPHINLYMSGVSTEPRRMSHLSPNPTQATHKPAIPTKVIQEHPPADIPKFQYQDRSAVQPIDAYGYSFQCPPPPPQQVHPCPVRETHIRRTPVVSNTGHHRSNKVVNVIQVDSKIV